jgi:hypothetical protein
MLISHSNNIYIYKFVLSVYCAILLCNHLFCLKHVVDVVLLAQ